MFILQKNRHPVGQSSQSKWTNQIRVSIRRHVKCTGCDIFIFTTSVIKMISGKKWTCKRPGVLRGKTKNSKGESYRVVVKIVIGDVNHERIGAKTVQYNTVAGSLPYLTDRLVHGLRNVSLGSSHPTWWKGFAVNLGITCLGGEKTNKIDIYFQY